VANYQLNDLSRWIFLSDAQGNSNNSAIEINDNSIGIYTGWHVQIRQSITSR